MTPLESVKRRAELVKGSIVFRQSEHGAHTAYLGCDVNGYADNQIVAIAVTFDRKGQAVAAEVPRQSSRGSVFIDLTRSMMVREALLSSAGRSGADYLACVSQVLGGCNRHELIHSDPLRSLGPINPSSDARKRLHGEVVAKIVAAAGRAAGPFEKVARHAAAALLKSSPQAWNQTSFGNSSIQVQEGTH